MFVICRVCRLFGFDYFALYFGLFLCHFGVTLVVKSDICVEFLDMQCQNGSDLG